MKRYHYAWPVYVSYWWCHQRRDIAPLQAPPRVHEWFMAEWIGGPGHVAVPGGGTRYQPR